jgi:hypothetical protein
MKWIIILILCAVSPAQEHLTVPPAKLETITIPNNRLEVAQTKAQLIVELRISIYEDHLGIYNPKREAKIQQLAKKLKVIQ